MAERADYIATTGEFTRVKEERLTEWVTLQGRAEFSLPVVRFENGERRVIYPVCQDTELGDLSYRTR